MALPHNIQAMLAASLPDMLRKLEQSAASAQTPPKLAEQMLRDLKSRLPQVQRASSDASYSAEDRAYFADLAKRLSA